MPRIVDTNVHLLAVDPQGQPLPPPSGRVPAWWEGSTAEQVRGHMRQAGIDHTLVVATGTYDDSYVRASARQYPDAFTAIAKLDVSDPAACENLARLVTQLEVGGIRFESRGDDADPAQWLEAAPTRELWQQALHHQVRVSLASVRKMDHLLVLRRVLERFPALTVILRRMVQPPIEAGPPYEAAEPLFALAQYPNVYSTFSHLNIEETDKGASTYQAFFEAFIERFGTRRLMWASFFPAYRAAPEAPIKGLLDYVRTKLAFLPAADLDLLLGETAAGIYPSIAAGTDRPVTG
jgi:L-fuconolactonase